MSYFKKIVVIAQTAAQAKVASDVLSAHFDVHTVVHPRPVHKLSLITLVSDTDIIVVFGDHTGQVFFDELNHHRLDTVYINPDTAPHIFELRGLHCKHEVIRGWGQASTLMMYCIQKLLD